jgi:hypothetical protein
MCFRVAWRELSSACWRAGRGTLGEGVKHPLSDTVRACMYYDGDSIPSRIECAQRSACLVSVSSFDGDGFPSETPWTGIDGC